MDQKKIGMFLKELRKEKEMTQETLAEEFHVSSRTISRWETGANLPDISLLVEIADYYDIDVRELIEGERKSEMMNEELKDVANKMADYADNEKSGLLKKIQICGLIGTIVIALAIGLQCGHYEPNPMAFFAIVLSIIAFVAFTIVTLYVNGILGKLLQKKKYVYAVKIIVIVLICLIIKWTISLFFIFGIGVLDYAQPRSNVSGIENYDKIAIVKEESGDMDSGFYTFPDSTENMIHPTFESSTKTGMFDTDGYYILSATYKKEEYEKEVQRLSSIDCTIKSNKENVINKIRYDETTYNYPAYVASDGYDYVYEYALLDEANYKITYVLLSYPEYTNLGKYKDLLKKDSEAYHIDNGNVLENFTIYAHHFDGEDGYREFTDGE